MGCLYEGPSGPVIQDLKVTIHDSTLIFPSHDLRETHKKSSIFLSNIDQVLNFDVQTVHFFSANPEFHPETVAKRLKMALSKVLVPYNFLSGRLKMNPESGRLEIDCNGAGAGFVFASSEFSLTEIGDLVYPNPAFSQLIVTKLDNQTGSNDQPLCILQVTAFKCGGLAMGISTNHCTFDGLSFKTFLQNLASQAFDDMPLAVTPFTDRLLLAARSPPLITFPHHELLKLTENGEASPAVFDCSPKDLDFKIFQLSSDDVARLKEKARAHDGGGAKKISGFNVVTALIWRCKALSHDQINPDRESTVLYAVDIRSRLKPPLPPSYAGNAVLTAYANAQCKVLEEGPFWKLVEMVAEGSARMTDEYAKSAIDWGEIYKGFPHGEFLVSSWWRLGFADVNYPWGKPKYSCPVVYRRKDIILLFPDIDANNDGINVLVALPTKELEKFQTLFQKFME